MKRTITLSLLVAAGCTHDLTPTTDLRARMGNDNARADLALVDFEGARSEYQGVIGIKPMDVEANIGWSIADLLLLPDAQPVQDVLARCNQPALDVGRDIFGTDGYLARLERARAGTSNLTIHRAESLNASYSDLGFAATTVETTLSQYDSTRWLNVRLREGADGAVLYLTLNPDDVDQGDAMITPLTAGTTIDLSRFSGGFDVYTPRPNGDTTFINSVQPTGTLRFVQYGSNEGDAVVMEFDATIRASCASEPCNAVYRIAGRVEDTLSYPVEIDEARLPFGNTDDDNGPPRRSSFIVALEQCNDIDRAFLASKIREVGDLLEANSNHLAAALTTANPNGIRYTLPRQLLHIREDITLNATDVRALKTAVDIASAQLELAAQYKYAEGRLQDMIADYCQWADEDGDEMPECNDVRDFSAMALFVNLDANLMERTETFDLAIAKRRLESGLASAAAAMRSRPEHAGVLNFQVPSAASLSNEVADALDAARTSIGSNRPVALPSSPLYEVHLGAFFANPLDRSRLLMLTGLTSLVGFTPGDVTSPIANDRNDDVFVRFDEMFEDVDDGVMTTGGVVRLPPDTQLSCAGPSSCGVGYTCSEGGRCERALPRFMTEGAWESALSSGSQSDWPAILSRSIEVLFDF